jgi:hypothetical protein
MSRGRERQRKRERDRDCVMAAVWKVQEEGAHSFLAEKVWSIRKCAHKSAGRSSVCHAEYELELSLAV